MERLGHLSLYFCANLKTGTFHCPATRCSDALPVDPSAGGSCWVTLVQAGSAPTWPDSGSK